MEDLEVRTYNFAVEGIGFVKSLEKDFPEAVKPELKQSIGAVSLKYMDALDAKENEDFASNLRGCFAKTKKSYELLKSLEEISNESLMNQKNKLINDSSIIIEKLEQVISKLIY